jgi:hypothetical protein
MVQVEVNMSESRWKVTITPENGEARISVTAYEGNVTAGEIAHYLAKGVVLLSDPAEAPKLIPTEAEVQEHVRQQGLLRDHPAERLFVKDGKQLWLGEEALTLDIRTEASECTTIMPLQERLLLAGWTDAGPVPEGVVRVCDYAKDPESFLESL